MAGRQVCRVSHVLGDRDREDIEQSSSIIIPNLVKFPVLQIVGLERKGWIGAGGPHVRPGAGLGIRREWQLEFPEPPSGV